MHATAAERSDGRERLEMGYGPDRVAWADFSFGSMTPAERGREVAAEFVRLARSTFLAMADERGYPDPEATWTAALERTSGGLRD